MKTNVECRGCGKELSIDLGDAIMSLVSTTKKGHVFGGFYCYECDKRIHAEEECDED